MQTRDPDQSLKNIVEKIKRSGALGRSPAYKKLLDYLMQITESGLVCSEMTVAIEVFNKGDDFDVTSDSTVRVYVYNLRQKLKTYYEGAGSRDLVRLSIPKGAYRLAIDQIEIESGSTGFSGRFKPRLALLSVISLVAICSAMLTSIFVSDQSREPVFSEQQQQFWGALLADNKPLMIVIGDYYIFGEKTQSEEIRLVREFNINSESDLRREFNEQGDQPINNAEFSNDRFDLGLTYLPRGSAYAISQLQGVLQHMGKTPRIAMMSEFSAEDLRSNHVIYIGYISGLGVLENYTFSTSRFDVGYSYDQLSDIETGETYISNFIDAKDDRNFVDYGLISGFSVAEGNQILILAGTRDAGLMEMSELATDPNILDRLQLDVSGNQAFMSLFEVYGFNLTNISGHLIGSEYLDAGDTR